jgi:hypothetical protein
MVSLRNLLSFGCVSDDTLLAGEEASVGYEASARCDRLGKPELAYLLSKPFSRMWAASFSPILRCTAAEG